MKKGSANDVMLTLGIGYHWPRSESYTIPLSDVGFAERVKSEKAKRFWDQLAEDAALFASANCTQSKASTAYSVSAQL